MRDHKVEKTICPEHSGDNNSQLPPVDQTTRALSKDWDKKLLKRGGGRVQEGQSTSVTQSSGRACFSPTTQTTRQLIILPANPRSIISEMKLKTKNIERAETDETYISEWEKVI